MLFYCNILSSEHCRPESLIMLLMYVVYCVALRFNNQLEAWALTWKLPFKLPTREEQAALVTYKYVKV